MCDDRLQARLADWELPELETASTEPAFNPRVTLQLEREQLFITERLEERLSELNWPQPTEF